MACRSFYVGQDGKYIELASLPWYGAQGGSQDYIEREGRKRLCVCKCVSVYTICVVGRVRTAKLQNRMKKRSDDFCISFVSSSACC